jgi:hypothetical protein
MRCLAYSLLLISSHALASGKIDPPSASESDKLRGNVLVWHDATLFVEPKDDAATMKLATFDDTRKDHVGHVIALRVIATKGSFVEVELTDQRDCTDSRVVVSDDLARVRMFVRRDDLAPVLTKPFKASYPDGTSIAFTAGTPVVPTDAGTYVVSLHGDEVEVDVPAGSVSFAYSSPKSRAAITIADTLSVASGTKATLGDRTVKLGLREAAPIERRDDTTLVSIDAGCVAARMLVPSGALTDLDEPVADLDASTESNDVMSLRDELYLPKLTALSIGTRQVALAAKPIYLHAEPMGKNACIQRAIRIETAFEIKRTDEKLRVCAPATKVVRERLRSARSAPR